VSAVLWIVYIAVYVVVVAGLWKTFQKAGEEGWKAIIPIWNTLVQLKIVGRPWWWLLLLLIPVVNIIVFIIVMNDLSKSFGKGTGFTVGLVILNPIFTCILGFGDAQYHGPAAASGGAAPAPA
jgi:hypothetical protein